MNGSRSVWPLKRRIETGSFRSSGREISFRYDRRDDVLRLRITDCPIEQTVETTLGLVDLDAAGDLVQIVVYGASKALPEVLEERGDAEEKPDLADTLLSRATSRAVTEYVAEARERVKINLERLRRGDRPHRGCQFLCPAARGL